MKKFIPALLLCLPLAAMAAPVTHVRTQKDFCQSLLQGAAFNRYLEQTCAFNEGVVEKITQITDRQCKNVFTPAQIEALQKEAVDDGKMLLNRYGKGQFCQENFPGYRDAGILMEELRQRGL